MKRKEGHDIEKTYSRQAFVVGPCRLTDVLERGRRDGISGVPAQVEPPMNPRVVAASRHVP